MSPPLQRVSGRRVVLAFFALVLTLAGGAITFWYLGREPMGTIRAMTPVDDTHVLLMRDGHRQHHFVHFTYRDLERGQLWSVPFRELPSGAVPVAAAGRAISWVRNDNGRLEIHAFDLDSGEFAFRVAATYVPPLTGVAVSMVAVDGRVVAAASVAETKLYVVDAATGSVTNTIELDASPVAPVLRIVPGGVEVVPGDGVARLLNVTTGNLAVLPPGFRAPETAPSAIVRAGTARYEGPTGSFEVRADGDDSPTPIGGAAVAGHTLWVFADASVAAVDIARRRVRTSSGPLGFVVVP